MKIALLCSTERGYLFIKKMYELLPKEQYMIFTFREEPFEPPFLDNIHSLANEKGARFIEAKNVGANEFDLFWQESNIDLLFAVNWRFMIPKKVYSKLSVGGYIFHDSLLPIYRGFSPTVWAIINGEKQTGVSLFEIAEEVDAGDLVDQKRIPILHEDTIQTVMTKVTSGYLELLERNLTNIVSRKITKKSQDNQKATFTCKRIPSDNKIEWNNSSISIYNLIRGVTHPYTGAFTNFEGKKLIIWSAKILEHYRIYCGRIPGRIVERIPGEGVVVLTGNGAILIKQTQIDGQEETQAENILKSISNTLE
jgi:methionyl-tRNA formyltransferase